MSICRYACGIYGTTSLSLIIQRLESLQNKAIKVLFNNAYPNKNVEIIQQENKILNIKQMINYTLITQNYYKAEYKKAICRPVRNNNNWLMEPLCVNSYRKRNLSYLIPHIFNKLPLELRNCKKYKLKKEIRKWIMKSTV